MNDAKRFLAMLFGAMTAGFIELRLIAPDRSVQSHHYQLEDIESVVRDAQLASDRFNAFFGVVLREDEHAKNVPPDAPATAVWADIDSDAAVEALEQFPLRPTLIVGSGSGTNCHAYWVLTQPLPADEVVGINRALATRLGADVRSVDRSRILRVPGTLNHKDRSNPPTEVRLTHLSESRHPVSALRAALADAPRVADSDRQVSDPVALLLSRLTSVRRSGDQWTACCPAHKDEHPSLSIAEGEGGRCLVNCHAGCTFEAVVAAVGLTPVDLSEPSQSADQSESTRIVDLVSEFGAELFHDEFGEPFASVRVDEHIETMAMKSPAFEEWIQRVYYRRYGKVPRRQTLSDAFGSLRGMARFDGPQYRVSVRVAADDDGRIWLDLGTDAWSAIVVDESGWQIVAHPDVRFHRPGPMQPLPEPTRGGSLDALKALVNIADEDWILAKGWLVAALNPEGPYPLLVLLGEQGTAKSTTAQVLRWVIDPVHAPRRPMRRSERDLAITASNGWCLFFDNLTRLTQDQSDALCRLSTGGGFATRELYTDRGEVVFDVCRPTLLTGIDIDGMGEDLRERSLVLELPTIPSDQRLDERTLWAEFTRVHGSALGALLDAVSMAFARRDQVALAVTPRMADAARWMTAAEPALGVPDGQLAAAFLGKQRETSSGRLSEDPATRTLMGFIDREGRFHGTHFELYNELIHAKPADVELDDLPRNPQQLSVHIKRVAAELRLAGYGVKRPRRGPGGARLITLTAPKDGRDARDAS